MSTPLITVVNDAGLTARAYNLGLKMVPNLVHILTEADLAYWEAHLYEMKAALALGLVRSTPKIEPAVRQIDLLHLKTVTSDGRSGQQFVEVMEANGWNLGDWAKKAMMGGCDTKGNPVVLMSPDGIIYKPVVIRGSEFTEAERITSNIRKVAAELKCLTPPWWLAPLIRESVSDEEILVLGIDWLVVMHEPIIVSDSGPNLLSADCRGVGRWLRAFHNRPTFGWDRLNGFVFLAPQE